MAKSTPTKTAPSAPEDTGPSSSDLLGSLLAQHKEDHYNDVIPTNVPISTGSLKLDSYVRVRSGGVVRLTAKMPESGKTSQAFVLADNFMKTMSKSKTLYVKAEGRLSLEIQARTGMRFVTDPADWKPGTVFILSSNTFETVADFVIKLSKNMYDKKEYLCVIIDSLDGLILKADKDTKGISSGVVAGVPKLTKLLFRHLALPITHYDMLLLITGQYSADISIDPYVPKIPRMGDASGGSSLPHQCDYVLSYAPRYQGDFILEDENAKPDPVKNKILGVWATVEIKKSATDTTGTKIKIPIRKGRVGSAIWVEKEVVDMALQWDMINRKGAWFSFNESIAAEALRDGVTLKDKIQGMAAVYEYFETEKAVFDWFYEKFKKLIAS